MSLRQWLLSSGIIGLSMFGIQFIAMMIKGICDSKMVLNVISVINIIVFILKFMGYNVVGCVLMGNVIPDDLPKCDSSLQSYM
jgi:hypothetical protein